MKKILAIFLILAVVFSQGIFAYGEGGTKPNFPYNVAITGTSGEISIHAHLGYDKDGTLMVPLTKISEALGYSVKKESATKKITIEGVNYKITLKKGMKKIRYISTLKCMTVSKTVTLPEKTTVRGKVLYVPVDFFRQMFNGITVEGENIKITPEGCTSGCNGDSCPLT